MKEKASASEECMIFPIERTTLVAGSKSLGRRGAGQEEVEVMTP